MPTDSVEFRPLEGKFIDLSYIVYFWYFDDKYIGRMKSSYNAATI